MNKWIKNTLIGLTLVASGLTCLYTNIKGNSLEKAILNLPKEVKSFYESENNLDEVARQIHSIRKCEDTRYLVGANFRYNYLLSEYRNKKNNQKLQQEISNWEAYVKQSKPKIVRYFYMSYLGFFTCFGGVLYKAIRRNQKEEEQRDQPKTFSK